jgi:hypothetical protein
MRQLYESADSAVDIVSWAALIAATLFCGVVAFLTFYIREFRTKCLKFVSGYECK